MYENKNDYLIKYYRCQTNICFCSELFGDRIEEHGSKVLTLFAEIYAFMVDEFGLGITPPLMIDYSNSERFKQWFWSVKHKLGEIVSGDPDFNDIGKWIGKGLFLKIALSLIYSDLNPINYQNNSDLVRAVIPKVIKKQNHLLQELLPQSHLFRSGKSAIKLIKNGYTILHEKVILDKDDEYFFGCNII